MWALGADPLPLNDAPIPPAVAAACTGRLAALLPAVVGAARAELRGTLGRAPQTADGYEAAAVAAAGQDTPREVAALLRAAAAAAWALHTRDIVAGRLVDRAQQAEDANGLFRLRSEWAAASRLSREPGGEQEPPWGAAELHAALGVARDVALKQAADGARAAELRAEKAVEAAREAQKALVTLRLGLAGHQQL